MDGQQYSEAEVEEYWIVDPQPRQLTVLALAGTAYREQGVFGEGDTASSAMFPELRLELNELFARCET